MHCIFSDGPLCSTTHFFKYIFIQSTLCEQGLAKKPFSGLRSWFYSWCKHHTLAAVQGSPLDAWEAVNVYGMALALLCLLQDHTHVQFSLGKVSAFSPPHNILALVASKHRAGGQLIAKANGAKWQQVSTTFRGGVGNHTRFYRLASATLSHCTKLALC